MQTNPFVHQKPYIEETPFKMYFDFPLSDDLWATLCTFGSVVERVIPPDYCSQDSDLDYYGYRETLYVNIDTVVDDNGSEVDIEKDIPPDVKREYELKLNTFIDRGDYL